MLSTLANRLTRRMPSDLPQSENNARLPNGQATAVGRSRRDAQRDRRDALPTSHSQTWQQPGQTALDAGNFANLDNVPPELITHIFSYLRLDDRLSAALVSRHWRHVALDTRTMAQLTPHILANLFQGRSRATASDTEKQLVAVVYTLQASRLPQLRQGILHKLLAERAAAAPAALIGAFRIFCEKRENRPALDMTQDGIINPNTLYNNMTALMMAVGHGNIALITALLDEAGADVNVMRKQPAYPQTALGFSVLVEDPDKALLLCQHGADCMDIASTREVSVMHLALNHPRHPLLREIYANYDAANQDINGIALLQWCHDTAPKHPFIAQLAAEADALNKTLMAGIAAGITPTTRPGLRRLAWQVIKQGMIATQKQRDDLLHAVCSMDSVVLCQDAVARRLIAPHAGQDDRTNPLTAAIREHALNVARWLIDGCNVSLENLTTMRSEQFPRQRQPLEHAIQSGHIALVKLLLRRRAPLLATDEATLVDTLERLRSQIDLLTLQEHLQRRQGSQARAEMINIQNDLHTWRRLFARIVTLNARHQRVDGKRLLVWASERGDQPVVEVLLWQRRPPDPRLLERAARVAANAGHMELAALLCHENGAAPSTLNALVLRKAIRQRDTARVRSLLEAQPELVHARDGFGRTPLHIAFRAARAIATPDLMTPIAKVLLKYGASMDAHDNNGATPAHILQGAWNKPPVMTLRAPRTKC